MSGHDAELDQFRQGVSCAVLLERATPPWQLDRQGSTRRALKYRRQEGEVVIVNHDGRGWWDPQGSAKGDVFDLVQFLDPGLNFGQVRKALRPFVGLSRPTQKPCLDVQCLSPTGPCRSVGQHGHASGQARADGTIWLARVPSLAASFWQQARPIPCGMGLTGAHGSRIATKPARFATSRFADPTSKARSEAAPRPFSG